MADEVISHWRPRPKGAQHGRRQAEPVAERILRHLSINSPYKTLLGRITGPRNDPQGGSTFFEETRLILGLTKSLSPRNGIDDKAREGVPNTLLQDPVRCQHTES